MTKHIYKLSLGALKQLFKKGRVDLGNEIALMLKDSLIDKEGKVKFQLIEDMIWDVKPPWKASEWPSYDYRGYKSEPKWGEHKKGEDVVYEGSPFQQTEAYDSLPRLSALEFPDKVGEKTGLVLVKYSAKWCDSCKDLTPITNKINMEIKNAFYLMDVADADNKACAKKQGMNMIPTVILYEDGKEIDRVEGVDEEALKKMVERLKNPEPAEPSDFGNMAGI